MRWDEGVSAQIALIVGGGDLPLLIVESLQKKKIPFIIICFDSVKIDTPISELRVLHVSFENIAQLFDDLKKMKIDRVAFCGYFTPPKINFDQIEPKSQPIITKLVSKLDKGDSILFDEIINQFKKKSISIINLFELIPESFAEPGVLTAVKPSIADTKDIIRAEELFASISKGDLGQSLIVEDGRCLGVEASPGTDALLEFIIQIVRPQISEHSSEIRGVFYKAPKIGQSLLIDIPVIGEKTVRNVKQSGLSGIAIKAQKVIILNKAGTVKLANELGVFIWSK